MKDVKWLGWGLFVAVLILGSVTQDRRDPVIWEYKASANQVELNIGNSTTAVRAPAFTGPLTGNVTGNASGTTLDYTNSTVGASTTSHLTVGGSATRFLTIDSVKQPYFQGDSLAIYVGGNSTPFYVRR